MTAAAAAADDDDDDDEYWLMTIVYCVMTDGSDQGDDWCVESNQRDCIPEAEAVGSSQTWNLQGWFGPGLSLTCASTTSIRLQYIFVSET